MCENSVRNFIKVFLTFLSLKLQIWLHDIKMNDFMTLYLYTNDYIAFLANVCKFEPHVKQSLKYQTLSKADGQ